MGPTQKFRDMAFLYHKDAWLRRALPILLRGIRSASFLAWRCGEKALSSATIYAIILANGFGLTDTGHGTMQDVLCLISGFHTKWNSIQLGVCSSQATFQKGLTVG